MSNREVGWGGQFICINNLNIKTFQTEILSLHTQTHTHTHTHARTHARTYTHTHTPLRTHSHKFEHTHARARPYSRAHSNKIYIRENPCKYKNYF